MVRARIRVGARVKFRAMCYEVRFGAMVRARIRVRVEASVQDLRVRVVQGSRLERSRFRVRVGYRD